MAPRAILLLTVMFATSFSAWSQKTGYTNFYTSIGKYDVSKLWCADSTLDQEEKKYFPFPEPLGFIGTNYQRFYIHYTSVRKSKEDPYRYIVTGKTRVRNNIIPFTGTITITEAVLSKVTDDPLYKEGSLDCTIHFYEDSTLPASGFIAGRLSTDFCLDKKGRLYYDAISIEADGYSNNQCTATWKSYKTATTKKCNWGDFRIPESLALDGGAGVFVVDEKYIRSGWESYVKAYGPSDATEEESKKARAEEDRKWWK